jgi:hypothetical protein
MEYQDILSKEKIRIHPTRKADQNNVHSFSSGFKKNMLHICYEVNTSDGLQE